MNLSQMFSQTLHLIVYCVMTGKVPSSPSFQVLVMWKMSYARHKLLTWSSPHLLFLPLTFLWLLAPPRGKVNQPVRYTKLGKHIC